MAAMIGIHQRPNPEYLTGEEQLPTAIGPVQLNLTNQDAEQRITQLASCVEQLLSMSQANSEATRESLNGMQSRDAHESQNVLQQFSRGWIKR